MHKMVVNQVMLAMGLEQSQQMATLFDGITRRNPEGAVVPPLCASRGLQGAVEWRDSGQPYFSRRGVIDGIEALGPVEEETGNARIGRILGDAQSAEVGHGQSPFW